MIRRLVTRLGARTIELFTHMGSSVLLVGKVFASMRHMLRDRELYFHQAMVIGVASLPLVLLIGAFTGMVSTWQANYSFGNVMPMKYLGVATFKAVTVELGPVLTGLVLAGRVGSSLAAELATMQISEQVDALKVQAIDPVRYLVAPRMVSATIMVPVLVILAVIMAMAGGFFVASVFMGLDAETYFRQIQVFFQMKDIHVMLLKSAVFGGIISLTGSYVGITAKGGAEGVGQSTIQSFVISAVMILVWDYILATLLF